MYCKYFNFKLFRKKNFVEIKSDVECILESIEDDFIIEYQKPQFLIDIIHDKLSFCNCDQYYIYVLKVPCYNRITDYKKIWKLGGFTEKGLFDGYYDCKNERIYFGVSKGELPHTPNVSLDMVTLSVPNDTEFSIEKVFEVFKNNCFYTNKDKQEIIDTLTQLQCSVSNSIIIYEVPHQVEIYLFGHNIENKFNLSDLPTTEVIER